MSVVATPLASAVALSPDKLAITERPVFTAPSVISATSTFSVVSTFSVGFSITTVFPVHPTSTPAVIANVNT